MRFGLKRNKGAIFQKLLAIIGGIVVLCVGALLVLSYFAKDSYIKNRAQERAKLQSASNMPVVKETTAETAAVKTWEYRESVDEMSGEKTYFASRDARDLIRLDSPYQGENQPRLVVRRSKKEGYEVLYLVSQGQILCNDCQIQVRFDDLPPMKFKGGGSATHKTDILFLSPEKKFVEAMKKAKTVKIEVPFFRNGTRISTFDVVDFKDR